MFLLLLLVDNIKKNSAFHKVFTPIYVCVCVCVCVRVRACVRGYKAFWCNY